MSLFWYLGFMLFSCQPLDAVQPPLEVSESDLGVVYPPFGGRLNFFSSKYGPIYREGTCFVIWNRAGEGGQLHRIKVTCPEEMLQWDNCAGLLVKGLDERCACQSFENGSSRRVDCPKTVDL
ncbi:MAG: hypothetical protein VXZ96_01850 [Myxococcota bacterium]|nr:hypothetical protein [Myxococcota bacterium]